MYQFMCILGPGVLTWLLRREVKSGEVHVKKSDIFIDIAKIISYALINMSVIVMFLKPLGRVQLVTLSNGMLEVHYGSAALFAATCLALALGVISFIKPNNSADH